MAGRHRLWWLRRKDPRLALRTGIPPRWPRQRAARRSQARSLFFLDHLLPTATHLGVESIGAWPGCPCCPTAFRGWVGTCPTYRRPVGYSASGAAIEGTGRAASPVARGDRHGPAGSSRDLTLKLYFPRSPLVRLVSSYVFFVPPDEGGRSTEGSAPTQATNPLPGHGDARENLARLRNSE